jgi:hypothetical protein
MNKLIFVLLSIFIFLLSCQEEKKKVNNNITPKINKDTTHLINLVKSYEPKKYKGKVPQEYYNDRGEFDFWRFPLVYPYYIGCIDIRNYGRIYSYKDKETYIESGSLFPVTDYFDKFIFDNAYLVASKCKSPFDSDDVKIIEEYLILSFNDGSIKKIKGLNVLKNKLKEIKFSGDTTFMTIKEYEEKL